MLPAPVPAHVHLFSEGLAEAPGWIGLAEGTSDRLLCDQLPVRDIPGPGGEGESARGGLPGEKFQAARRSSCPELSW